MQNFDITNYMTPREAAREKRNHSICSDYKQLRAEQPTLRPWRCVTAIARSYELSVTTIANVLRDAGLLVVH
jgi:hypothetical protein